MPSVSVVIPTYNHARYLQDAIQSVFDQTFTDFEIIVVDDGSKDETREVMKNYTQPNVIYIYQENKGLPAARNTGLKVAQGRFVAFLDADDVFFPDKLEIQIDFLNSHPQTGVVFGGWNYIDQSGQELYRYQPGDNPPGLLTRDWLLGSKACVHSALVRREWVDKVGGFDETFKQVEDWDFWLRLAYAGCTMSWHNEIIVSYRKTPGQMTQYNIVNKNATIKLLDKFFKQSNLEDEYLASKAFVYARLYLVNAGKEFSLGQFDEAQSSISLAVKMVPELNHKWDEKYLDLLFEWEDKPDNHQLPMDFRRSIFRHLPVGMESLSKLEKDLMVPAGIKHFYYSFHRRDWAQVRRVSFFVMYHSPRLMFDRGFWKILFLSFKNGLAHTAVQKAG